MKELLIRDLALACSLLRRASNELIMSYVQTCLEFREKLKDSSSHNLKIKRKGYS